ncbi:MAG: Na+/H+ antiporter subunit E [Candidatus Velthaea sp.]
MTRRSWRRDAVAGAIFWLAFTGLEVLLVGKIDAQETPAGAVIALGAAVAAVAALRLSGVRYRLRWSWAPLVLRLVRNVARDTFIVSAALVRGIAKGAAPRDRIVDVPFDAGGDDAESAARRALVTAGISMSPNGIVVDVDRDRRVVRVHRLVPDDAPPLSRAWPL